MKLFFFSVSIFLIVLSAGFKVILVMSYSNYEDFVRSRDRLLSSKNLIERVFTWIIFFVLDYRLILGFVGLVGLMTTLLIK